MRKIVLLLTAAIVAFASTDATAQETTKDQKRYWKGIETNSFGDNWEVKIGVGTSLLDVATKGNANNPGTFFGDTGWNLNIAATKWFVPTIGARLQLDGGSFRNKSFDAAQYGDGVFKTPYVFVHGDVMLNLSNWIGGYREDRVYYAIPYAGFGYTAQSWTKKSAGSYDGEFAVTGGLLNKFRVCKQIDIELDIRTWLFPETSLPAEIYGGGVYNFAFSASVGVAYRFNKRDWAPSHSQAEVDGYLAEIDNLKDALEAQKQASDAALAEADRAIAEARALADDLAKTLNNASVNANNVVFFNIGEAALNSYAKASLDKLIASLEDGNVRSIHVDGYADNETGSDKRNAELAEQRALVIKQYILEHSTKVSEDQIITDHLSIDEVQELQAFSTAVYGAKVNRCAIITIQKKIEVAE